MLRLFADSDCDVTPAIAAEYGYTIISMPYSVDGKTIYPYQTFEEFDYKSYYGMLRSGVIPTTSALNEEQYRQYFEPVFAAGDDIFYVHFSRRMSGTFDAMDHAVEELKARYPERKFYALDTKGITVLGLIIVREIGDLFKAGKTAEEVMEWAKTEIDHYALYFFADNLKFFHRSGRVSGLAATMGGLIGLRPVINMPEDGSMVSLCTVKGRIPVMEKIVEFVEKKGDDVKNHRIIIASTDAMQLAEQVGGMLKEKFGEDLQIEYVIVNPTAGGHCGPDGVGVAFHSKER